MIKAIIGLGNPGHKFYYNRHNIGFRIVDAIAERFGGEFSQRNNADIAQVTIANNTVLLVKPTTFMNSSGSVIPYLTKQGIKVENIVVVHDELELPFGKIAFKQGGSARGHNGLRSIISVIGPDFFRLRFGIGRPEDKAEVPNYVLQNFNEPKDLVENYIKDSVNLLIANIEKLNEKKG
jgi:PTH1 family peptidyl-tRNA hydrolase